MALIREVGLVPIVRAPSPEDAFRAAEKRLIDFKQQQYGEVKTKEARI